MLIGGVLLFAVSARGAVGALRDRRSLAWLLVGSLGVFAYPLAFYSSMHLAGVAIGTVVSLGAAPVFAAVLEFLVDRRRVSLRWAVATVVAVVGVVLLATGGSAGTEAAASVLGVLLGLVAAFSYALYTFASERAIGAGHSSRSVMGALFGVGAVLLAPGAARDRRAIAAERLERRHHGLPGARTDVRRLPALRRRTALGAQQHRHGDHPHRARGRDGSGRA